MTDLAPRLEYDASCEGPDPGRLVPIGPNDQAKTEADGSVERSVRPKQDLTGDVAWLWTHCRALGMTRRSDSGLMRDDVALYAADLHALLRRALPMADALDATKTAVVWTADLQGDASMLAREMRRTLWPNA